MKPRDARFRILRIRGTRLTPSAACAVVMPVVLLLLLNASLPAATRSATQAAAPADAQAAAQAPASAPADTKAVASPTSARDGLVARARAAVQAEVDRQRLPGLSLAVVVKGELVWSEGFGMADLESGSRATGSTLYRIGSVSKPNSPYADLSNKYAGGGLTSTVEDLARLHIAYQRGALLKPASVQAIYTNQTLSDGSKTQMGLAWQVRIAKTPGGRSVREVSHSGGSVGANSLLLRYPDQDFAIVAIANHNAKLGQILERVIGLFEQAGAM